MIYKFKEILMENAISFLAGIVILNLLISLVVLKNSKKEATETFTRLIIDHNTKEDLKEIKKQVCRRGIKSILQKNVDKNFVDITLAEKLIDADFSNFDVEDSERLNIAMRSDYVCIAVIQYEGGQARAFNVDLTEDKEYAPLLYLVQDINETATWERS